MGFDVHSAATTARALGVAALLASAGCKDETETLCRKLESFDKAPSEAHIAPCIQRMTRIRSASPAGFDCLRACGESADSEAATSCIETCSKRDDVRAITEEEAPSAAVYPKWIAAPAKRFRGSVTTVQARKLSYGIELTEDFERLTQDDALSASSDGFVLRGLKTSAATKLAPQIYVHPVALHASAAAAASALAAIRRTLVKEEPRPRGFLVSSYGAETIEVSVVLATEGAPLTCRASMMGEEAVQHRDELLPWLERLCGSITTD